MRKEIGVKCIFIFILLLTIAISGCNKPLIKIGYAAGLTGSNSELGVSGMYAALIAVDEINNSGGIKGQQVQLITKDDHSNMNDALKVDKEFKEEGVVAIIGHMISAVAELTIPYINKNKILMISPTMAMDSLGGKDDYFFRLIPSNKEQANIIADAVIKSNTKNISVLYSSYNAAFTTSWMEFFSQRIENTDIKISYSTKIDSENSSKYHLFVKEIEKSNADSIVILASADEVAAFCQVLKIENVQKKIFLPTWSMTDDLLKRGGKAVEGNYGVNFIDYESKSKKYVNFKNEFISRYGMEPPFSSILTYESFLVLFKTLENSPDFNSITLKNELNKNIVFEGLQQALRFDKYGDVSRDIFLYQIRNGKFSKVE